MGIFNFLSGLIYQRIGARKILLSRYPVLLAGTLPMIWFGTATSLIVIACCYARRLAGVALVMMTTSAEGINAPDAGTHDPWQSDCLNCLLGGRIAGHSRSHNDRNHRRRTMKPQRSCTSPSPQPGLPVGLHLPHAHSPDRHMRFVSHINLKLGRRSLFNVWHTGYDHMETDSLLLGEDRGP